MRLDPKDRKKQILDAAFIVASRKDGWSKLTREAVAKEAGCTDALVNRYFGTMKNFKRTLMRLAIRNEYLAIVAQGVAIGDKYANAAPIQLRAKALTSLL